MLHIIPTGCLFHFGQNIYRKIQAVGLQFAYNTENPAGVRRLMGLPLVPPTRLQGVYLSITQHAPNIQRLPWCTPTCGKRTWTLFCVNVWNAFDTVDHITNICEGWHSALKKAIIVYSPTIFKVIDFLQKSDAEQEWEVAQLALGAPPKKRKAKYVKVDAAIARLTDRTFANAIPNI